MKILVFAFWLTVGTSLAQAQGPSPAAVAPSTAAPAGVAHYLGAPVPMEAGPWVLGEVLFFSSDRLVSDYEWRQRVRGSRGALYTKADILGDVESLLSSGKFDQVEPRLYAIPDSPVPSEYASITASTSQVRLVFSVREKVATPSVTKPRAAIPPAAVSGLVITPTAYRGAGRYTTPGMGLDFNAMYFIGRLYGKNSFPLTPRKTNYIDRLGVWLLTADGKMQVQSEGDIRPALAVGAQGAFFLRDSPQPSIQNQSVTVKVSDKNTKILTDGYFVASKKFGPARTSVGVLQGTMGDIAGQLSEFLTPEALRFYNNAAVGTRVMSRTVPFASVFILPKPAYPLGLEFLKFNGSPMNPWLVNFKLGYFLKLNFDVSLLKYQGGYDILGVLQFRYNQFPSR